MSKLKLAKTSKGVMRALDKHSPQILTGFGIGLGVSTVVLAVKGTPKALKLIEEELDRQNEENGTDYGEYKKKLKPMEVVKTTWKCYIPAAITGTLSAACLLVSNSVNSKRITALATACTVSETALKEYKNKVIETVGETAEKEIRDSIAKDKLEQAPVSNTEVIITEKGNMLCYDSLSGRYFKSDINSIESAVNKLNSQMRNDMYISLSELYYELGLSATKLSDVLGWNINHGQIEISFSAQIAEDGTPCIVLDYSVAPIYDYSTCF